MLDTTALVGKKVKFKPEFYPQKKDICTRGGLFGEGIQDLKPDDTFVIGFVNVQSPDDIELFLIGFPRFVYLDEVDIQEGE